MCCEENNGFSIGLQKVRILSTTATLSQRPHLDQLVGHQLVRQTTRQAVLLSWWQFPIMAFVSTAFLCTTQLRDVN